MIRATTPTIEFILPEGIYDNSKQILVTFKQGDKIVFEKNKADLVDATQEEANKYKVHLTQKETIMLDSSKSLRIQLRFLTNDDEAYVSNKKVMAVKDVLNDKEMK